MTKVEEARKEIAARINEFYWKPGEKITSERDLALLLNVSRVTIKAAIQKLIEEGYLEYIEGRKGTFVAQSLTEARPNKIICVAIDNKTPAFSSNILEGIHDSLMKKGYHTLYFNTLFDSGNIMHQVNNIINKNIGGFIFAPLLGKNNQEKNNIIINNLKANNIPLVQVDRFVTETYGSYVGTNNILAFYNLTKYLINKHFEHFLILDGYHTTSLVERKLGVEKALKEHNIQYTEVRIIENKYREDYKLSREEIDMLENAEVIISLNQNLLHMAKQHISKATKTCSISASVEESIADISIIQPMYEIGRESGRLIIEGIENDYISKKILVSSSLYKEL